jgi:hypothetical protein
VRPRSLVPIPGLLLGLTLSLPAPAAAQAQVPLTVLSRPEQRFGVELSAVNGVRELPDGRVLVADGIEEVLLRLDPRSGRADTLGRAGQGPGEYRSPDALYPMPGGATLLVDLGNGRLNLLGPDGGYRESMPIAQGGDGELTMVLPRGTDAAGRIYFQARGRDPAADSAPVMRWDRTRRAFEAVAQVRLGRVHTQSSGGENNRSMRQRPQPFPAGDAWAVAPDGSLAVARAADYHLEWLRPGGATTRGRPFAFTPVPVGEAERREWAAEMSTALRVSVETRNGEMRAAFSRRPEPGRSDDTDGMTWPAAKPAFPPGGAWTTSEGEAWVERWVPAGAPRSFDVFGPDAALRRRVTLPAGRRLAGFGRGTLYLQHADAETGLVALERYRR